MDIPFRALADFTYDWESWLDESGRVRWVNPAITRLTGYSVAEALAMPDYPLPLVAPEDRPVMAAVLEQATRELSGNHVEFRILEKGGSERWAAISWQPLEDETGRSIGVRTSVRDIDQHKKLEGALESALRRAEAANRAKVEFLANVSHELRTPLVSILGYTELLRAASQDPKQKRFLATIASQGRQLERLVSDLLDFSTLGAGSLPLRPSNVGPGEVVREAVRAFLPRAQEKGLELLHDIAPCPLVSLDPARLTQVVSNLIDNAIKYTERGRVTVSSHRDEGTDQLVVTVEDTGPGLPGALDLFEPFRQGEAGSGGVGLGLAIAQRLCRAMGGDLTREAGAEVGARLRVTVTAPLAEGSSDLGLTSEPSRSIAQSFPLDVLVVDDVDSAREFLADALRSFGYSPRTARSGAEAFAAAAIKAPDLTLIDLQMPGQDGWSVARELRRLLGPGHVLVGASASHLLADSPGLAAAGFDAFLPKPTPLGALEDLLRRVATRRDLAGPLSRGPSSEPPRNPATSSELDLSGFELLPDRIAELEALSAVSGEPLVVRTLERILVELPDLANRLATAQTTSQDLRRVAHDLAGIFSLLGAREARALALSVEEALIGAHSIDQDLRILLLGTAHLRNQIEARLETLGNADSRPRSASADLTPKAKKS